MPTLLERNTGILRRIDDLSPIGERVADVLRRGKREHLLMGVDWTGAPFAPLAPSTLKSKRRGTGPALVPDGDASSLIIHYEVTAVAEPGRLIMTAGWPFGYVRYLASGTRRMPRRDPGGFREEDRVASMAIVKEYLFGG